ncbi:group III truncated hemoglobin [Chthonobacter albigriseus]|uniref:group III truncated hemoglobin n=1 Tax=Chthonobacter albigriseus TaxID=1683161 RepID=UPI00188862D7|nr:group III truncated hemoglobin [Chthonobacter albigriseus]
MSDEPIRVRAAGVEPFPDQAPAGIGEEDIRRLVHGFYARIREDDLLGPIFGREIASDRWPIHLEKMCAFWSSVVLRTERYDGRPLSPHLRIGELSEPHFRRWLALFRETAEDLLSRDAAAIFIGRAERIAHSFRLSIAFHRGEDAVRLPMIRAGS